MIKNIKVFMILMVLFTSQPAIQAMQEVRHKPAQKSWIQRHPLLACLGALTVIYTGNALCNSPAPITQNPASSCNFFNPTTQEMIGFTSVSEEKCAQLIPGSDWHQVNSAEKNKAEEFDWEKQILRAYENI